MITRSRSKKLSRDSHIVELVVELEKQQEATNRELTHRLAILGLKVSKLKKQLDISFQLSAPYPHVIPHCHGLASAFKSR